MPKDKSETPEQQVKPSAPPEETPNPNIEPPPLMWLQKSWYKKPKPGDDDDGLKGAKQK